MCVNKFNPAREIPKIIATTLGIEVGEIGLGTKVQDLIDHDNPDSREQLICALTSVKEVRVSRADIFGLKTVIEIINLFYERIF
ncbi:MAG: hypothetical protein PHS07_00440 [Patescibacteria group bacterium]|nr:hypothetical protein [Patescibacteria group bacterium]